MSDMIDHLAAVANDAGADAAEHLRADVTVRDLDRRIRAGARRRRIRRGSLAGAAALVVATAALVVPRLMEAPVVVPPSSDPPPRVVLSGGSLTTYADGSMAVLTSKGDVVEVPASLAGVPRFKLLTKTEGCALVAPGEFPPGWTFERPDYTRLVTAGRAQVVDASGYHNVLQGQQLAPRPDGPPALAFSLDADPAVSDHLTMVLDSRFIAPDGQTLYYQSQFEARPAIDTVGSAAAGTLTAVVQSRTLGTGTWCVGTTDFPASVTRYLSARVYLHDSEGRSTLIATHNSWTTLQRSGAL